MTKARAGTKTKNTVKAVAKAKVKGKATATGAATVPKSKQERSQVVRDAILQARDNIEHSYLDLAHNLYEAYHHEYYSDKWGYASWEEYCSKELDIQYRKSMYLVEIWDKVKSLNLPEKKVEALGWSRMKDLVSVITKENAKDWMEKADKMTSRELTEAVKVVRRSDKTGTKLPTITTMTLRMSEAESSVITDAIEAAKRLCETENAVVALEMVCQDWLEEKGQQPERAGLEDHIKFLQEVYGVTISYVGADSTEKEKKAETDEDEEELPSDLGSDEDADTDINALLGIED